jgi:hypothetical protein
MPAKIEMSTQTVIDELKDCRGNVAYTASQLKVSRGWLWRYIGNHPTVREALDDIKESVIDKAELSLEQRMMSSDTLLIFFLKTQGKGRGYTERQEITGADGGPVVVVNWDHDTDDTD